MFNHQFEKKKKKDLDNGFKEHSGTPIMKLTFVGILFSLGSQYIGGKHFVFIIKGNTKMYWNSVTMTVSQLIIALTYTRFACFRVLARFSLNPSSSMKVEGKFFLQIIEQSD